MWLGRFEFLSLRRNVLAIRFAEDIKQFNDPSAIRPIYLAETRARPLVAKTPDQQPPVNPRAARARLRRLAGLDRRSLPRQGLAKRSWLTMSEPLLTQRGNRLAP